MKKLLILGAYRTEKEIVKAAQDLGCFTIVTDNHENWNEAPAKSYADEAWDISWSDLDTLKEKCLIGCIDGIMAGFSEKRIAAAQKLSASLGLPFYGDSRQIQLMSDKEAFNQSCKQNGLTTPKSYQEYDTDITYPVIVKPVDNGGSKGITICHNKFELEFAIQKAKENSISKRVIIEQYLTLDEIMVFYIIADGEIFLSSMCDRLMQRFDKNITQLPVGYSYPSKYLNVYLSSFNEIVKKYIHDIGIKNGLLAFQAFMNHDTFIPFDPTFRLDGTLTYHFEEALNNINVLKMLINYSLTGSMCKRDVLYKNVTPAYREPCFELPILLKNGRISTIYGLEYVRTLSDLVYLNQIHDVGDTLTEPMHFSQMLCRIQIKAKDIKSLKMDIEEIYKHVNVLDEYGQSMVIGKVDFSQF